MRLASYWIPEMESAYGAIRQGGATAADVVAQLKASLDGCCVSAARHGHAPDEVQDALYAVVAWIDEMAMSFDWPGAAAWRLSPLQRHYFSTTRAGVGFFERLGGLAPQAREVREVYALMLLAGFQGDYSHRPPAELTQFRRDLLERVAQENDMAPLGNGSPLFPKANASAAGPVAQRLGPSMSLLILVIGPLLALLALFVYLDVQLTHAVADLIGPMTKGL